MGEIRGNVSVRVSIKVWIKRGIGIKLSGKETYLTVLMRFRTRRSTAACGGVESERRQIEGSGEAIYLIRTRVVLLTPINHTICICARQKSYCRLPYYSRYNKRTWKTTKCEQSVILRLPPPLKLAKIWNISYACREYLKPLITCSSSFVNFVAGVNTACKQFWRKASYAVTFGPMAVQGKYCVAITTLRPTNTALGYYPLSIYFHKWVNLEVEKRCTRESITGPLELTCSLQEYVMYCTWRLGKLWRVIYYYYYFKFGEWRN